MDDKRFGSLRRSMLAMLVMIVAVSVVGCSVFGPHTAPVVEPPPPPVTPELPRPTAMHRFEISPETEVVGHLQRVTIGTEDTLSDIARRFDVGYEEMVLANPGVDPWLPGVGREVLVPTQFVLPAAPREGIVANLAAMRIFYYPPKKEGEPRVVYTFPMGVGRVGWKTREGTTKVIERTKNPVWIVPASIRAEHAKNGEKLPAKVAAGPDNPLGKYRLRLGWSSYLIHGTNKPAGIGMRVSHGCMQLYPEDIEVLFGKTVLGTRVTIVNQPYLFGWREGVLHFQAYMQLEDDHRAWSRNPRKMMTPLLSAHTKSSIEATGTEIDWETVAQLMQAPRALVMPLDGGSSDLDALIASSRHVENVLPEGSNWDGRTELTIDEKTLNELTGLPAGLPPANEASAQ